MSAIKDVKLGRDNCYYVYDDSGKEVICVNKEYADFLSISNGMAQFKWKKDGISNRSIKAGMITGVNSLGEHVIL